MSYMGIQELKDADLKSGSATGDGSTTTFAIGWTPPSEQSLFVTINGVLQSASALSISGANCVFTAAPASADAIEFKGIQSSGTVVTTTGDGTIDAAKLADNSVTSAKILASAVTNAKTDFQPGTTFKGDGSSADGKITLNCSQNTHGVSIQSPAHSAGASYTLTLPTTDGNADEFMQTDGAGALTFAAVSGGLSVASQWNMTTDFTGSVNPIINWSESGTTTSGNYPTTSGITESAGTFTLASTGYWLIMFQGYSSASANDDNMYHINTSTSAGTGWGERSKGGCFTYSGNDAQVQIVLLLKCTNTADNQVRFGVTVVSAANDTIGSSTQFKTGATFLKVADL